jgi:hypothetical protein
MTTLHATIPSMTVPDGEQQRKKRSRGRSLRTNVLLRPRRVSLKNQPPPPLELGVTTATDVSLVLPPNGHVDEYSSDDYDEDGSEDEDGDEEYDDEDLEEARFPYPPIRSRSGSLVMVMSGMGRSRSEEVESAKDTVYWGWVVLMSTWLVFVVGMGSVCGVWDWAWGVGSNVCGPYIVWMVAVLTRSRRDGRDPSAERRAFLGNSLYQGTTLRCVY